MNAFARVAGVALVLVLSAAGPSGAADLLQEEHLSSPITDVIADPAGAPSEILVSRGSDHGLVNGSRGEILGRTADGGVRVIGRAELVEVGPTTARARLLREEKSELTAIPPKSTLQVRALLPKNAWREGVLRELVLDGIVLLDNYKDPLYDAAKVLRATDSSEEDAAIAKMIEQGHEVVEFTLELPQIVTHGKWKGKKCPEVLTEAAPEDYVRFLRFVKSFPGKYLGKDWKVSEIFATWIINDMPESTEDLAIELQSLPPAELTTRVRDMKWSDVVYTVQYLRREVGNAATADDTAKKRVALLEKMLAARTSPKQPAPDLLIAEVQHARADLLNATTGKGLEAAAAYTKAADVYFKVTPDIEAGLGIEAGLEGIICLNNATNALKFLGKNDEVLVRVTQTREAIAREIARAPNAEIAAHLPLSEVYAVKLSAQILQDRGEYRRVIEMLSPLVDRHAATGAPGARQAEIDLLSAIAKAHRKLGEVDQAAKLYERMSLRAGELGDLDRQATLYWDIADMLYDVARYEESAAGFEKTLGFAEKAGNQKMAAKAIAARAQALWSLGRNEEAVAGHQRALEIRQTIGDESGIAWQLVQIGKIERDRGDRVAAIASLEKALALQRKLGEKSEEAATQVVLGEVYLALSRLDEAEKAYAAGGTLYAALKQVPDQGWARYGEARAASARGNATKALEAANAVIAAGDKTGDVSLRVNGRILKSRLLRDAGRKAEALTAISLAVDAAGKDAGLKIDALVERAFVDLVAGDRDAAKKSSVEITRLAAEAKDASRRLSALALVERIALDDGRYADGLAAIETGIALARESGNRVALVDFLQQKSWALAKTGKLADARAAVDEAMPLSALNGNPVETAYLHNSLSELARYANDVQQELAQLELAIALMRKQGYEWGVSQMLYNRSLVKIRLRDFDGARADNAASLKALGKREDAAFRMLLDATRGWALGEQQKYAEAEATMAKATATARIVSPVVVPALLSTRGRFLAEKGDFAKALPLLEEAVRIEEGFSSAKYDALATLGEAQVRAGKTGDAEKNLVEALKRAEAFGGTIPWRLLLALAKVEIGTSRKDDALGHLTAAVKNIEGGEAVLQSNVQKQSYWEDKKEVYVLLVKLLLEKNEIEHALRYVERAKVAEVRDVQRRAGDTEDLQLELEIAEQQFQKELRAELEKPEKDQDAAKLERLESLLADTRKRRGEFIARLEKDTGSLKQSDVYMMSPLELEKLQESLPPGMLVISPMPLENELVVFAIARDVLTAFRTPMPQKDVERLVGEVLKEASPGGGVRRGAAPLLPAAAAVSPKAESAKRVEAPARKLYDAILKQAIDRFGMPKTLVISASGTLRYLPFAALHDGSGWLVEKTQLAEITSLDQQKLVAGAASRGPVKSVLALADPDGSLPGARTEVEQVRGIFTDATVFDGEKATLEILRRRIQTPGYDVVHLATHGRLDAKSPEQSNILLAGQPLYYKDIPTLRFDKTGLVVLSACDTASRGSGVEVTGLAYQFSRTNVRTIVATLWPVDDAATAKLMTSFYKHLADGDDYAGSLASAQRELAKQDGFEHPYYWAPFVLIGAPQ